MHTFFVFLIIGFPWSPFAILSILSIAPCCIGCFQVCACALHVHYVVDIYQGSFLFSSMAGRKKDTRWPGKGRPWNFPMMS